MLQFIIFTRKNIIFLTSLIALTSYYQNFKMLAISKKYYGDKQLEDATEVTDKYFGKKELEDRVDNNEGLNMEIEDDNKAITNKPSTLVDPDGEQECEQKKGDSANTVSIDVTKALLLLGLNCWSSLEPGEGNTLNECKLNQYIFFDGNKIVKYLR